MRPDRAARRLKTYPARKEKFIFFYSEHGVDSGRGMLKVYPRGREGFNPTQHCPTYIYFPWKRSKETNENRLKKAKKGGAASQVVLVAESER